MRRDRDGLEGVPTAGSAALAIERGLPASRVVFRIAHGPILRRLSRNRLNKGFFFCDKGGPAGFVFPSWSWKRKKVVPIKHSRPSGVDHGLPSDNRLRDTFSSVGQASGVDFLTLKALMGHSMKKADVTAGYINAHFADMARMRGGAEAIAEYFCRELGWATERRSSVIS